MKLVKSAVAACMALALGAGVGAASAAAITIDDTAADDTITITANDFENGFSVNGILIQQGLNNPGSVTLPEALGIAFLGHWIAPVVAPESGSRTIYLVEAQSPNVISDIFEYQWIFDGQSGVIQGFFMSDSETGLGTLPIDVNPNNVFVENGRPVDFSLAFLTGQIVSDADAVPEPGTLALLGLGLLPLGWASRRKRG